jgi:predicted metalloprotease with PDZ domain
LKSKPFALAAALALLAAPAFAQPFPEPQPVPMPPPTPAPKDVAYPGGLLHVSVDATDLDRRIFRVRETIPLAAGGPQTILFPQWVPGGHSPRNSLEKMAGLEVRADGQPVAWVRDPVDVFAFHIEAPAGAKSLELSYQVLTATAPNQGRVVVTPEMLDLQWLAIAMYPAGYYSRRIQIEPEVKLPAGWSFGTALEPAGPTQDGVTRFKPVPFDVLVDSPMFAGRYFRQVDLDPGAAVPVRLNMFADRPEQLEAATAEQTDRLRELVRQAYRLFGSHHYDHYDFLFAVTDRMSGIGLEHHRSSEDATGGAYFLDWSTGQAERELLPHEYAHSWNGKFRRPADLWTPNLNVPMRDSLLWVYEGQTQYWGFVLAGRSGLISKQDALDALAATAATYANRVGRTWRSVEDTTNDPIVNNRRPQPWTSWQRAEDYYSEGQLVWLDVDTLIRTRSAGKRSLDDFARAFFGVENGNWSERPYTFADVVDALNAVEPYDWASFLDQRINKVAPKPPLDGLTRGGWRLVYAETETPFFRSYEGRAKIVDLTYSIGLALTRDGDISAVQWDGPAFKAGITGNSKLIAVNGIAFDADRLKEAITAARRGGPLELLVRTGDHYRTVSIDWKEGLRYPRLERIEGAPDLLSAIYAPKK